MACDSLIANLMYSLLQLHSNRKKKTLTTLKQHLDKISLFYLHKAALMPESMNRLIVCVF